MGLGSITRLAPSCVFVLTSIVPHFACTVFYHITRVQTPQRKTRWVPHSFYMNFCTHSYTMPWWQWSDWEKNLDWMALHGITMPLIAIGREVVFRKLLSELGMTDVEIRSHFTGPAFLAWHRMGNLKSFAGPLPKSYDMQLDPLFVNSV
jgi:hypothetical protein